MGLEADKSSRCTGSRPFFFSQCPEIVIEEVVVVHFRKNMSFLRF